MHKKWIALALALGLQGGALGVYAQETKERTPLLPPPVEMEELFIAQEGGGLPPKIDITGDNLVYIATEMSFGGKVVKGAPYSAQSVTEKIQTLSDGNRIVHKNTAQVYRDSEGRTRRDQSLGTIGPYASAGEPAQTSFINDPVAGVNYILEPRTKTARKLPPMQFRVRTESKASDETAAQQSGERSKAVSEKMAIEQQFVLEATPRGQAALPRSGPGVPPPPPPPGAEGDVQVFVNSMSKAETKTEKLENRVVEGVQAEGHRSTTTIPAGAIGNELPIQIVHERWYSPELQVVVMTRHTDPRFGETVYRLTNIQRGEPSATLFQVPSDYTVKESLPFGRPGGVRRARKPTQQTPQEN